MRDVQDGERLQRCESAFLQLWVLRSTIGQRKGHGGASAEHLLNPPPSLYGNSRFVEVGEGSDRVRLCVAEFPPAPPDATRRVLLIHGNPSHMDHWVHTVPMLRSRGAVLAYDQAGFGRSDDFANRRPTLERSAALATALLNHALPCSSCTVDGTRS